MYLHIIFGGRRRPTLLPTWMPDLCLEARAPPQKFRALANFIFLFPPPTPRSKNRNQSSHTDKSPALSVITHSFGRKSPDIPSSHGFAKTRRHRSTFAAHLADTSILSLPAHSAVCTLAWTLHCSDHAGLRDRSPSGGCPAKGDEDMSLRSWSGGSRCSVAEEWEEEVGSFVVGDKFGSRYRRELFVVVNSYAIACAPSPSAIHSDCGLVLGDR